MIGGRNVLTKVFSNPCHDYIAVLFCIAGASSQAISSLPSVVLLPLSLCLHLLVLQANRHCRKLRKTPSSRA
jgi:hypothetical protein